MTRALPPPCRFPVDPLPDGRATLSRRVRLSGAHGKSCPVPRLSRFPEVLFFPFRKALARRHRNSVRIGGSAPSGVDCRVLPTKVRPFAPRRKRQLAACARDQTRGPRMQRSTAWPKNAAQGRASTEAAIVRGGDSRSLRGKFEAVTRQSYAAREPPSPVWYIGTARLVAGRTVRGADISARSACAGNPPPAAAHWLPRGVQRELSVQPLG